MHSEICPVCEGEGKYKDQKCHGCKGKGWIEVRNDSPAVQYMRSIDLDSEFFKRPGEIIWSDK